MSVTPQNTSECINVVCVVLFSLVVVSFFVSSLTAAISSLQSLKSLQSKQFWILRKFLKQKGVSTELTIRLTRYLTLVTHQRHVQEQEVHLLELLSASLASDLRKALYVRYLEVHPYMRRLSKLGGHLMRDICCKAVETLSLSKEGDLFHDGSCSEHMYFVIIGELAYRLAAGGSQSQPQSFVDAHWFCEAVLWTSWVHRGIMTAITECDLVTLNGHGFGEVVAAHPNHIALSKTYAADFVLALNRMMQERRPISDDQMHLVEECMDVEAPEMKRSTTWKPSMLRQNT